MKNIGLLLRKNYKYRYGYIYLLIPLAFLLGLTATNRHADWSPANPWGFGALCLAGMLFAMSGVFSEILTSTRIDFQKATLLETLPVTKLEVIAYRYVDLSIGILFTALAWWVLSILGPSASGSDLKLFACTPALLVLSVFAAFLASGFFLVIAGMIESGFFVSVLGGIFVFFLVMSSTIFTYYISRLHLNTWVLAGFAAVTVGVVILFGSISYRMVKTGRFRL